MIMYSKLAPSLFSLKLVLHNSLIGSRRPSSSSLGSSTLYPFERVLRSLLYSRISGKYFARMLAFAGRMDVLLATLCSWMTVVQSGLHSTPVRTVMLSARR